MLVFTFHLNHCCAKLQPLKLPATLKMFSFLLINRNKLKIPRNWDEFLQGKRERAEDTTTLLPPWLDGVAKSLSEDSISATRQLRSHRSKPPKWANPQRTAALPSSVYRSFPLYPPLTPVTSLWLMAACAGCALMLGSGGSPKCKMVNKCALMGNTFISLMPICTGSGACFQRSWDLIGDHESPASTSDAHMWRDRALRPFTDLRAPKEERKLMFRVW